MLTITKHDLLVGAAEILDAVVAEEMLYHREAARWDAGTTDEDRRYALDALDESRRLEGIASIITPVFHVEPWLPHCECCGYEECICFGGDASW